MPDPFPDSTPVTQYLDAKHVPYRLFQHPGPVQSLEQAAEERGQAPEQIVRSILFRLGKNRYAMVLTAGPKQISWLALRKHFGQSRLTMASREEVYSVTGYEIGAVSPFGVAADLPILVDSSVASQSGEISIGSGRRGLTVIMQAKDLLQALGEVEIGNLTADSGSAP